MNSNSMGSFSGGYNGGYTIGGLKIGAIGASRAGTVTGPYAVTNGTFYGTSNGGVPQGRID